MKEDNQTTYREAVREGIRNAMQKDDRVFLMGEDVGRYGGCFAVSKGLFEEFGKERIIDTPLCESAFTGLRVGVLRDDARLMQASLTIPVCRPESRPIHRQRPAAT